MVRFPFHLLMLSTVYSTPGKPCLSHTQDSVVVCNTECLVLRTVINFACVRRTREL